MYSFVSDSSHFISQNRFFLHFFGNREGKLPAHVVKHILDIRRRFSLTKSQVGELVKTSIKKGITSADLDVVGYALDKGLSLKRALIETQKYRTVRIDICISKEQEAELIKKHRKSLPKILGDVVYGDEKPIKRPVF